ncbi:MAG: hypothetical protein Q8O91_08365 [Candidatus Aminicenantes bacterium]|nr:hypothetical protein [Candidatus Aminicenantes bacterium]
MSGCHSCGDDVKGRAFGSPLARGLYPRASTAEVDPRAKPGARPPSSPYAMPDKNDRAIFLCRKARFSIRDLWQREKNFI